MLISHTSSPSGHQEQALASRLLASFPSNSKATGRKKLLSSLLRNSYAEMPTGRFRAIVAPKIRVSRLALTSKRLIDIILAATGLVILSPLLALIAVLIKLDCSGPVLYSGPRAGKNGHSFTCFKFRTMIPNADHMKAALRPHNEREGPFFKMVQDPRVTRIGRILRRYSFDEIPQLWNVLTGDMSLVGPRPHPLDDLRFYVAEDLRRLDVTPGITGLWQVTARRDPSFQRNMALDLEYIERWTLLMDFRIMYKTIFAVVRGTGA